MQQNSEHVNITLKTLIFDLDSGDQETQEQTFTGEWTKKRRHRCAEIQGRG